MGGVDEDVSKETMTLGTLRVTLALSPTLVPEMLDSLILVNQKVCIPDYERVRDRGKVAWAADYPIRMPVGWLTIRPPAKVTRRPNHGYKVQR